MMVEEGNNLDDSINGVIIFGLLDAVKLITLEREYASDEALDDEERDAENEEADDEESENDDEMGAAAEPFLLQYKYRTFPLQYCNKKGLGEILGSCLFQ